jgi:hypothetical protein
MNAPFRLPTVSTSPAKGEVDRFPRLSAAQKLLQAAADCAMDLKPGISGRNVGWDSPYRHGGR